MEAKRPEGGLHDEMKFDHQRVLITGGAGFIGSHLAERLAGCKLLRILDNFTTGSRANLAPVANKANVEIVQGDIRSDSLVLDACESIDVIFHLAVSCLRTSINHPRESHDVNAGGTLSVCEAALRRKVSRLVYVSSSEVYGSAKHAPMDETHPLDPMTVYGAAKLAGEQYAKAFHRTHGLPVIVIRPFNTYGPREPWQGRRAEVIPRFVLRGLAGRAPVVFGDGQQTRDFTFVTDTVDGIVMAAGCDALLGEAVNIATGRETSVRQVAEWIAEFLRLETPPTFAAARPGDVVRHVADVSKARRLFGFQARTPLHEGLRRTIQWLESHTQADEALCSSAGDVNW